MTKPIISVVLPVYNEEKFIGECIESILNQTYTDFELIIINDASTDRSLEINNSYKDQLESVGLVATGVSPDGQLVEIVEHEGHPFMAGTQFHPEFLSRPTSPHPMFREFVGVICKDGRSNSDGRGSVANGGNGTSNLGLETGTNSETFRGTQAGSVTKR